jgi:hypothetical protein
MSKMEGQAEVSTLGRDSGNPKKKNYPLHMTKPTMVFFPDDALIFEKVYGLVTLYFERPDVITSTMCEVPPSWKRRTIKFKGYLED